MREVYLLDTNIILDAILPVSANRPNRCAVLANLEKLSETEDIVALSVIAMAEVTFGLFKQEEAAREEIDSISAFWEMHPFHLPIDDGTIEPYSRIRAELFRVYGTPRASGRSYREKLPEDLYDRVTGRILGIDERDLLIASVAVQYNYVLVTNDEKESMNRIQKCAASLSAAGQPTALRVQQWKT